VIDLYLRRWDIEISFREDKRLLGIVRTRATTWNTFHNELAAVQIYRILMALLLACIAPHLKTDAWAEDRQRPSTTSRMEVTEEIFYQCLIDPRRPARLIDRHAADFARHAEKYRRGRIPPRRCLSVEEV
jgi:Transposase DDE domain